MWIFLNNAFISIVDDSRPTYGKGSQTGKPGAFLRVRARFAGDIRRVFPDAKVETTPGRDYLYRARIPREVVMEAIAKNIAAINYGNFKGSVPEDDRHDTYQNVWGVMSRAQEAKKRGRARGRRKTGSALFDDRYGQHDFLGDL